MKNLLQNALKYASDGQWLRISARAEPNRKKAEVLVAVEDRGPGIDPVDLPHIFDPFYRGQNVVASSIPGAGLGLSLLMRHLQAHGGRVTVKTSPGQGAAFTLHLPAFSRAGYGETL
ncbi:MAG: sensor histidine kinase [Acidobacteria bacterium]|nr:sensor histidine kinase [Acidobacteriota bacterium]